MALWSALLARPSQAPLNQRPSLTLFFLLVGSFFLTFLPHVEQLPVWISATVILALIIRSIIEYKRLPLPSSLFCGLIALCLLAGILFQFNTMLGRQAGTAFMAGLLAIKFFELRGPRDISVIIFSSFFVVMSTLLFSQALELFIYSMIMMWVLTSLLLRVQIGDQREDHLLQMLRQAGLLFLQALPLTIFLFFFFPRYPGKLLLSLNEATIGISDTMQPGSIARLNKDDSEAFYVRFSNCVPPLPENMYWRGLVLWQYSANGAWTPGELASNALPHDSIHAAPTSPLINQEIVISAHYQRWLFALDSPVSNAQNSEAENWAIRLTGDILQLPPDHIVDHTTRYEVTSAAALAPQERDLSRDEIKSGLQLPDIDPDVRAFSDTLWAEAKEDPQEYAQAVMKYFRQFDYSLNPGTAPPGQDWLRYFLLEHKVGFCEHFASAFVILMRLHGIPARIVVGYHGAQYNPYANIYVVHQADAHAWAEIWLDSRKIWAQRDPTAMASTQNGKPTPPGGSLPSSSAGEDLSFQLAHSRVTLVSRDHLPAWLRQTLVEMQLRRQQVETNWNDWVFSYDPDAQSRLTQLLGLGKNPFVLLTLSCLAAAGLCAYGYRLWLRRPPPTSPVETFYGAFCRNMAQRGIPRAEWEGPLAFTDRAAEALPEKREAIRDVGRIVAQSRYGPETASPAELERLKNLLTLIAATQAASSSRDPQDST